VVPPGSEGLAVNVMGEPAVVGPLFEAETVGETLFHVADTDVQPENKEASFALYE
jgi:hypothetical protein